MIEYAIEADPGRLTAVFPIHDTWDDVVRARAFLRGHGVPETCVGDAWPRVLARVDGGRWRATEVPILIEDVPLPLFDGYEPAPAPDAPSADQRRTRRQAAMIAAGAHPLGGSLHPLASRHRDATSPKTDPFTCGSCYFRRALEYHGRSYPKCAAHDGARISHGAASDVRAWWPACREYSAGDSLSSDAARHVPEAAS